MTRARQRKSTRHAHYITTTLLAERLNPKGIGNVSLWENDSSSSSVSSVESSPHEVPKLEALNYRASASPSGAEMKAAYGLTRAATSNPPIPTAYLVPPFLRDNPGATLAVAREMLKVCPDVLVLAGWMHIVSEGFLDVMHSVRALSPLLSPSASPESKGEDARGFETFQRGEVDRLGVMVHCVIAEVDRGAPIIVREVHKGEDPKNDCELRMHRTEWEIIVEGTKLVLDEVRPISNC
ncbi:hypothetical protein JVT61DRAFT_14801 [Boletus reticuloceps]|uniref:phosphoribosylglycinamide formyltransferase 1 n=1 Tax=Boletus reticuloceps TaxID=495285 RepID=A0A8I3AC30_9AGAM|nr:hypothetical protein JVT61DRAFT_14801 [Boletus reticuloceps]